MKIPLTSVNQVEMSFSKVFETATPDEPQGNAWIMRVVVVGSGVAGVSCVEELFRLHSLGYAVEEKGDDGENEEEEEPLTVAACEAQPLHVTLIASSRDAARATVVECVTHNVKEIAVEMSDDTALRCLYPDLHVVTNTTVECVVPEKRIVRCSDGSAIKYDRLCICTGARPDIFQSNHRRILTIRDTESVEELKRKVASARRVAVVGNGGVAMELVEAITTADVVWLVKHGYVGNTFLDAEASAFILPQVSRIRESVCQTTSSPTPSCIETSARTHGRPRIATSTSSAVGPDWMRQYASSPRSSAAASSNVVIEFNNEVEAIWDLEAAGAPQIWGSQPATKPPGGPTDFPLLLKTTTGKHFECDLVLCAIGVVPNTDFLIDTLALGSSGGILVDETMTTVSDNGRIYAAGDCVEVQVSKPEEEEEASCWFQMRLWSQARLMGRRAAQSMLGAHDENGLEMELFSHATHFFGFRVILLGLFNGQLIPDVHDADRIVRMRLEDGAWAVFDSRHDGHNGHHRQRPLVLVRCDPGVEFIKVVLVDGVVKGAMLLGETGLEDAMENLVLNRLDVTLFAEHLLDPAVDIEDFLD